MSEDLRTLCREKSGAFQEGMQNINTVVTSSEQITNSLSVMRQASADIKEGCAASVLRVNTLALKKSRLVQLKLRLTQLN